MRISSPPFLHPCYYGTDIDSRDHLIACHHSVPEIAGMIGADSLGFLPVESLEEMAGSEGICSACFDGRYPTEIPKEPGKNRFEQRLSLRMK
ncbi:MAG: amidophosphoribosyltransferase, partial [Clostridia bacterium]|nr:amidophosphoribosyltransferase [Clostridia bacterium]